MFGWVWTACGSVALECEMKIGGPGDGSETGTRIENEKMIKCERSESENGRALMERAVFCYLFHRKRDLCGSQETSTSPQQRISNFKFAW